MTPRKTTKTRLNAVMFAILVDELMTGPCTVQALCDASGLNIVTVRGVLRAMRHRQLIHVSGWEKDCAGRVVLPVWSWGQGRDVKRPVKSRAQINSAYRAKRAMTELAGAVSGAVA